MPNNLVYLDVQTVLKKRRKNIGLEQCRRLIDDSSKSVTAEEKITRSEELVRRGSLG